MPSWAKLTAAQLGLCSAAMRDIYYHQGNVHPRAIIAEQREDGCWIMENEGHTIATALPTDRFFLGFMEAAEELEWSTNGRSKIAATEIRDMIQDGAELAWLRTKEEVRSHNETHPNTLYLDLNGLHTHRFEDFPVLWTAWANSDKPLTHEDHEDWRVPLVALYNA